jgi:hypothetical protein
MSTTQYSANYRHWVPPEVRLINGNPVCFSDVCVHKFSIADSDEPDRDAAEPFYTWRTSSAGTWVIANAVSTPYWISLIDYTSYQHEYKIMARLSEPNETFWRLKWT